jgi:hypothetical protein
VLGVLRQSGLKKSTSKLTIASTQKGVSTRNFDHRREKAEMVEAFWKKSYAPQETQVSFGYKHKVERE